VKLETSKPVQIETVPFADVVEALRVVPAFAASDFSTLRGFDTVQRVRLVEGAAAVEPGQSPVFYWVVLDGKLRGDRPEQDGTLSTVGFAHAGEGFGEIPLMHGKTTASFFLRAVEDSLLIRFSEEQFWNLLACCPQIRNTVVKDMSERLQAYQVEALHREKLVTLGTLAAGLMHELHNPGSAAKRSAAQLRENLLRLQELSLRVSERPKTREQLDCMKSLLNHATHGCHLAALSSIDQADAEENLSQWLKDAGVANAWTIGPALVEMGFQPEELRCAQAYFEAPAFSDALNWLGALVSSVSQVCALEESIGRVSELVAAVKKFAYDEKSPVRDLDVHDSLQSTLTILGHKLRIKQIKVEKRFDASPSIIETRGSALSQVWTNLIDNAADASPANGRIEIATWTEPDWLVVSIGDHGAGIPPDVLPRIFEAFFTTKAQGSGTGLGLEIVHRIVTQKFDGRIDVESKPGDTRFIVRLPRKGGNWAQIASNSAARA
jgi:signal transduction histidine kinase